MERLQKSIINPGIALSNKTLSYAKSCFTWNGHDVSLLKEEDFLSRENWENNLKLFSEITVLTPVTSLMTKQMYQWLPNHSVLAEGNTNIKKRFSELSAESYAGWLKIGTLVGITFMFFRAMQYNFNCLDQYEIVTDEVVRECRILFGEYLNQPGRIAQVAVAGGAWAFAGWLIQHLGDFGLRGSVAKYFLNNELLEIYKFTADSASRAFWAAIDRGDEASANIIYTQARKIKALSPYIKETLLRELDVDDKFFKKMMRPFELFIEDLGAYEKEKCAAQELKATLEKVEEPPQKAEPMAVDSIEVERKI